MAAVVAVAAVAAVAPIAAFVDSARLVASVWLRVRCQLRTVAVVVVAAGVELWIDEVEEH